MARAGIELATTLVNEVETVHCPFDHECLACTSATSNLGIFCRRTVTSIRSGAELRKSCANSPRKIYTFVCRL